jgi:hypothetical protein
MDSTNEVSERIINNNARSAGLVRESSGRIIKVPYHYINYREVVVNIIDRMTPIFTYLDEERIIELDVEFGYSIDSLNPKYDGIKTKAILITENQFNGILTDVGITSIIDLSVLEEVLIHKIARVLEQLDITVIIKTVYTESAGYYMDYLLHVSNNRTVCNKITKIVNHK